MNASNLRDEDFIQYIFVASTHSYILFFTNLGKCYWLKVYAIPEAQRTARGKAIVNLIQLQANEKIKAFVTTKQFDDSKNVVMCTRNGLLKKTPLSAFSNPRTIGIKAIKLVEDDELIDAKISEGNDDILLATNNGFCNRFNEKDAREQGRFTQGVRGIRLRDKDFVIAMSIISQEDIDTDGISSSTEPKKTILAVSENGYGKRSLISEYTTTKRGSKGVITLKTTQRNGHLAALMIVDSDDDLMIITTGGMIIRQKVAVISQVSRNTQGVKLIQLNADDKVSDITRISVEPDDEQLDREVEKLNSIQLDTPIEVIDSEDVDTIETDEVDDAEE